ncbi:sensor histidine kinase [Paucidesulfovibrio longus]|uniref:sensor histidine kinase n=1 Tax=Paucidesulfovibrio longus TaxID=889 RepID=UPI0003B332A9|nr:HAMP domain-containing sensor histidine kinase [Paucidesulfovibrio longus]
MLKPNIRQKIVFGIAIFTICFGCIAVLSFTNIDQLEHEVQLVERTDDLSNLILEARRVEKNFFLYNDPALFTQGVRYVDEAASVLDAIMPEMKNAPARAHGATLATDLREYRTLLDRIDRTPGSASQDREAAQLLREAGQRLVEHSRAVTRLERQSILDINRELRTTLVVSMGVIAAVMLSLVLFVSSGILRPLRRVQVATRNIAQGTFAPLPIRNDHDEVQQVFVALNSMVEQLEKRQIQLVQAQKLSSIGTLSSGIAHQLNNPLNNISTSCQLLMENEGGKDAFADRMMRNIEQETLRARDIVKGLLEFSRHQDFAPSPFPLSAVVRSAMRLVSSQLPSNIALTSDIPDDLLLRIDQQRLQEAFINLILNAVQAIEPDEGHIRIRAEREQHHALITVEDDGSGMDARTLERIFDPFFSTKEVGQGTGLGLFIVYGIVEKHLGRIDAESTPGKGTTFSIRLPLPEAVEGAAENAPTTSDPHAGAGA